MPFLSRNQLKPGMVVAKAVKDRRGRLLIPEGADLTEKFLHALKLWGVPAVHVCGGEEPGSFEKESMLSPEAFEGAKARAVKVFHHNLVLRDRPVFQQLFTQAIPRIAKEKDPDLLILEERPVQKKPAFLQRTEARGSSAAERIPSLKDLIGRTKTLSSLPAIYHEIVEVVNHPRSSSNDIANVIRGDTGLTARLLRIVNSAFYGFPAKIETVSRAITVVGTNELCELALATSVIQVFDKSLRGIVDMGAFWRHSLYCGVVARNLASLRREPNAERYFVAGLLHDTGRLVILSQLPEHAFKAINLAASERKPVYVTEEEMMKFNHATVGRSLLEDWNLPPSLREAVHRHHLPSAATLYPTEAAIVHVAEVITNAMRVGRSGDILVPPLEIEAWDRLNLSAEILPSVIEESGIQVIDLAQVFGIDPE